MNILVTGGAGFIGSALIRYLIKNTNHKILNIDKQYYLSIVAIFKNESWILKEWLDHYIDEGVNQFFLIDNDSTDNYLEILQPYIDKKYITLFKDPTRFSQKAHYNKYILPIKNISEWFLVCDLDEFIYSRNEFNKISDYLKKLTPQIGNVFMPWKMYGSSGFIEHPKGGVVNNFIKRTLYGNDKNLSKTIIRSNCLVNFAVHIQQCDKRAYQITSDNKYLNNLIDNTYTSISEDILKQSNLHLNHYQIQSVEFFQKIKMTRGDVSKKSSNTLRDMNYFRKYDINVFDDDELSKKKYV